MKKRNIAIMLAGGTGERVGTKIPKQFISVKQKPIIIYSLEIFQQNDNIDEIIIVCHKNYIDLAEKLCRDFNISKVTNVITGGKSFLESCNNGISFLNNYATSDDIVVITSADRPFIESEEIDDSIKTCEIHGSGVAARSCNVCMCNCKESKEHSSEYMRQSLVQLATPWSFRYGLIKEAFKMYFDNGFSTCEDYPPALFIAAGNEVFFSKSNARNIKITEKHDILLMEAMLGANEGI